MGALGSCALGSESASANVREGRALGWLSLDARGLRRASRAGGEAGWGWVMKCVTMKLL